MLLVLKFILNTFRFIVSKIIGLLNLMIDEIKVLYSYIAQRLSGEYKDFWIYRKLNLPNWYHDFSDLGIKTARFRNGGYDLSQEDKQPILFKFIERASEIVKLRRAGLVNHKDYISCVDLFCADAFYSIFAIQRGFVDSVMGVDYEEGSGEGFIRGGVLDQADTIAKLCDVNLQLNLTKGNVMEYTGEFDICLCIGGLYHISDPLALLQRITAQTRHALVIQTVIPSNVNEDEPFFVAPAPHWTWGSRFNRLYLVGAIEKMGWEVVAWDLKPLRANNNEWDKLSLSLVCSKR